MIIMKDKINYNFSKIHAYFLGIPLLVLLGIFMFLYRNNALTAVHYVEIQKPFFLYLNGILSQTPDLQHNLTQMGDAFVVLSLLSIFIIYTPKLWEALIPASLISLIFAQSLKHIFDVPRPATILDLSSFHIIGEPHIGYSSFPSGHSITIFTIMSVMALAYLPKSLINKILCIIATLILGLFLALTRVGVGAHYPIDVLTGATLGYLSGILGIVLSQKYRFWAWISAPKYQPIFMVLFLGCILFFFKKISEENLPIFYLPLLSLIFSLYLMTKNYVQNLKK